MQCNIYKLNVIIMLTFTGDNGSCLIVTGGTSGARDSFVAELQLGTILFVPATGGSS